MKISIEVYICPRCKVTKPLHDFLIRKNGKKSWCKQCYNEKSSIYYHDHTEKCLDKCNERYNNKKKEIMQQQKEYRHRNKEKVNIWYREYNNRVKTKFFDLYGGKCECCGETEYGFLSLDHVNGQVGQKKDSAKSTWIKAIKTFPNREYRVLCMNCNFAIRYGRICPHKKDKQ